MTTDRLGAEHWHIHFYVEGSAEKGVVKVHMVREEGAGKEWEYRVLALDVPGRERIWLENREKVAGVDKKGGKMFGVKWW